MSRFAEKVKARREELKISQDRLGEMTGLSRRTIVAYENGEKTPRASNLRKLAATLEVTERYLTVDDCEEKDAGINDEPFIQEAREAFGNRAADEMAELLARNEALFAGGVLSEDQKDQFFEALSRAYFMNKQRAREKFGRHKD